MAVLIGFRIRKYIYSIFDDLINITVCWKEAEIALYWVKECTKCWKQFIANRIMDVQDKTDPKFWFHFRSKGKPADFITKGISVVSLIGNEKWFYRPHWLRKSGKS